MIDWQLMETAPRDGRPVLLCAKLSSYPPEPKNHFPIVGFWHQTIMRWKVAPEHWNPQEELIATHWAPIPKSPLEAGQ
jgi:hypothetical protein